MFGLFYLDACAYFVRYAAGIDATALRRKTKNAVAARRRTFRGATAAHRHFVLLAS